MYDDELFDYLAMMNIASIKPVSIDFLAEVQKAHIETFAWDTLDVFLGRQVYLNPKTIVRKFKTENRGGLCFELNGAFCDLLCQLGFNAYLVSAFVHGYDDKTFNLSNDTHAAIIVTMLADQYLVDVGWGDSYRNPVQLGDNIYFSDQSGTYRLTHNAPIGKYLMEKYLNSQWHPQYSFTKQENQLIEFNPNLASLYSGTNLAVYRKINCIKPTPTGFIALSDDQLQIKENDCTRSIAIDNQGRIPALLKNTFHMSARFVDDHFANLL